MRDAVMWWALLMVSVCFLMLVLVTSAFAIAEAERTPESWLTPPVPEVRVVQTETISPPQPHPVYPCGEPK